MSEIPAAQRLPLQTSLPFDSFTEETRKVLLLAEEEARHLNHHYIGTEHLLLGLLSEGTNLAAGALRHVGLEISLARDMIEQLVGRGNEPVSGEIVLNPRATAVVALAGSEAGRLKQHTIAPEHLLLAIVREGAGIAAGVIATFGESMLEKVHSQTLLAVFNRGRSAESSAPKSHVVTCRIDGYDLDALDALVEAGIRTTRSDAAAWFIHAGIEANKALLEKVYGTVAEIRRLRVLAQAFAKPDQ
jgi:ATP-dependent Clp protease ATP-binding subunit ClpA